MSVDREKITDAFVALVKAGTQKPVGDHEIPASGGFPYATVWCIPGGGYHGAPEVDPDSNADFVFQVDSVSLRRREAEWMADTVRRSVLSRTSSGAFQVPITNPTGWKVGDRVPDGGPGGVEVEGDPPRRVCSISERFMLRIVPA